MFANLAAEIRRTRLTQKEFAERLGFHEVTFSKKLNSKTEFTLNECKKILEFFNLKLSFDYLFEES